VDPGPHAGGPRERHRLHPLARRDPRPRIRRLRRLVAVVGHRSGRLLAGRLGLLRRRGVRAAHRGARPPHHARRRVVPGRPAQLRRARPAARAARPDRAARGARRGRAAVRRRSRPPAGAGLACLRRPGAHPGHPAARHGCPARRPGCLLPAEHPADGDRHARGGQRRSGLDQLLARLRLARRPRPVSPGQPQGADLHRRVPLRRPGIRPPRRDRADRGRPAGPGARDLPVPPASWRPAPAGRGRAALGGGHGSARDPRRGVRVRAGPFRAPALDLVLLRHHRPAQGDHAQPRRNPDRAAQAADLPHGPQRRGPDATPPPAG